MSNRRAIRIISAGEIKQCYSMRQAIDAMCRAFSLLSSGEALVPLRFISKLPERNMLMLFKPAFVENDKRVSVKFLTQREGGGIHRVPAIQGIVLLIDSVTGEILSIMDGEYLTALRTGAVSGLATRLFAREDAEVAALFGCGMQGRTQLEAVVCERTIKKVLVFDLDRGMAERFAVEMKNKLQIEVVYCSDVLRLKEVDVICTATNAKVPLFSRDVLKEGVHINAVGSFRPQMQELDPFILKDAKVYVDQLDSCLKESGDFIRYCELGVVEEGLIVGEIGDVCLGRVEGRESGQEMTVFKSVGVAIQDYVVASEVYDCSLRKSFGQDVRLYE